MEAPQTGALPVPGLWQWGQRMLWRDYPEGPSAQYLRPLVPNTIKGLFFGTRVLKYWVLGPSGFGMPQSPTAMNSAAFTGRSSYMTSGTCLG